MFSTERKQYIDNLSKECDSDCQVKEIETGNCQEKEIVEKYDWKKNIQTQTYQASHIQDSLFGSIYLAHHGPEAFKRVCKNFGKTDNDEKQKIITYLQAQCPKKMNGLVNFNLTKVLYNKIQQDLSTCPEIPLHCVIGLSLYYHCSIYIVNTDKNTYITFENTEENSTHVVLYKNPNAVKKRMSIPLYFVDLDNKCFTVDEIKENMFRLEHYEKPLKSIVSYKTCDLETIAQKLDIQYDKKMKKKDLYDEISLQCSW